jgi:ribose transport system substrate-binding protein
MKIAVKLFSLFMVLSCLVFTGGCTKSVGLNLAAGKKLALIAKMNNGYHWGAIKLGADAAAREFNVDVEFMAPTDEEDIEEQIKLVNKALENKKDALILAASDYKALVEVTERAYDQHIPVVIIDSEVDTKKIHSYIATDNLNAGKKAGEVLAALTGENCRLAVMSFVKGSRNAEQREEGLMSVVSRYPGMEVVARDYCLSDTQLAYQLTGRILTEHRDINAIVALNSIAAEGVAQAIDEMDLEGRVKVIAFDCTLQEIDFLEKGVIQATITQNPFSMGYLSVKYAVMALQKRKIPPEVDTGSKVIDRDNMYLPENQKLLFPFIK